MSRIFPVLLLLVVLIPSHVLAQKKGQVKCPKTLVNNQDGIIQKGRSFKCYAKPKFAKRGGFLPEKTILQEDGKNAILGRWLVVLSENDSIGSNEEIDKPCREFNEVREVEIQLILKVLKVDGEVWAILDSEFQPFPVKLSNDGFSGFPESNLTECKEFIEPSETNTSPNFEKYGISGYKFKLTNFDGRVADVELSGRRSCEPGTCVERYRGIAIKRSSNEPDDEPDENSDTPNF